MSKNNGHGNIGLTFENAIDKKIDTNYIPDFKGIEIKTTTRYSRFPISLFSIAFDGPSENEIVRLNNMYGSFDKDFTDKKTLIRKIRFNELSNLKSGYYLSLDKDHEKLYVTVYNENQELIEKESFVYLETIKSHLVTKLQKLAIIKASKKIINEIEYFRYYQINLYKLKNFDVFIDLLEKGLIEISLVSRINKTGINSGRYYNKNLVFQIKKENLLKLFDEIYYFNSDSKENSEEIQFL